MIESSCCFQKCDRTQDPDVCIMFAQDCVWLFKFFPTVTVGSSGMSWQLVTAIHDVGDGLTCYERHS